MKISIAMASYNGGRHIEAQLTSFAAQTRRPDELVICDDGSSDDTVEIARRFAAAAPFPVRIEQNPANLGLNANFARAMSLATGDAILISDQDDVWYPQKIAAVEAALLADRAKPSLIHDEHIAGPDGRRLPGTLLGKVREAGYPDRYLVAGNCTAHRRELLPLLLPVPEGDNYDGWFALVTDLAGLRQILPTPLQLYRRHGDNTSEPELLSEAAAAWSANLRFGLKDARRGWETQAALLAEAGRRIEANRALVGRFAEPEAIASALERIEAERLRLDRRADLLAIPRWRRGPAVLRLWSSGFYRDFSGARSAVKDLVRP